MFLTIHRLVNDISDLPDAKVEKIFINLQDIRRVSFVEGESVGFVIWKNGDRVKYEKVEIEAIITALEAQNLIL